MTIIVSILHVNISNTFLTRHTFMGAVHLAPKSPHRHAMARQFTQLHLAQHIRVPLNRQSGNHTSTVAVDSIWGFYLGTHHDNRIKEISNSSIICDLVSSQFNRDTD